MLVAQPRGCARDIECWTAPTTALTNGMEGAASVRIVKPTGVVVTTGRDTVGAETVLTLSTVPKVELVVVTGTCVDACVSAEAG